MGSYFLWCPLIRVTPFGKPPSPFLFAASCVTPLFRNYKLSMGCRCFLALGEIKASAALQPAVTVLVWGRPEQRQRVLSGRKLFPTWVIELFFL